MCAWKVGNTRVVKVVEGISDFEITQILPDASPEKLAVISDWLEPHYLKGNLAQLSIHSFVIKAAGKNILVDTCVGNDKDRDPYKMWHQLSTPFLKDLEAAGFAREDIDVVLCTHLHVDHVGWNTMLVDGQWLPTFPNARYLIAKKEWQYWSQAENQLLSDKVLADSVQPLFDAGLVDLVEANHQICPEVYFIPTPGHTPGHISVKIDSLGEQAVITGDMFHHPSQIYYPKWKDAFDTDDEMAHATRAGFIEEYSDTSVLILGTHFPEPSGGHIVTDSASNKFKVK